MTELEATTLSRRDVVKAGALLATVPLIGPGAAAAQEVPEVPRNRTLILRWGRPQPTHVDYELWNGYPVGANHQNGLGLLHEPLAFYSAFADKTIPWLAESWEYNADSTDSGSRPAPASPGATATPFSAEDVAYTINTVRELGANVKWGVDVEPFVDDGDRRDRYRRPRDVQDPGPALHVLHDLQVRHRPLHRARSTSSRARTGRPSRTSTSPTACRSRPAPGRSSSPRRSRRSSTGATPGGRSIRAWSTPCPRSSGSSTSPVTDERRWPSS